MHLVKLVCHIIVFFQLLGIAAFASVQALDQATNLVVVAAGWQA